MKKLIVIFTLILALVSCGEKFNYVNNRDINPNGEVMRVRNFSHNGHEYLEFIDVGRYGMSVVHDPECIKRDSVMFVIIE